MNLAKFKVILQKIETSYDLAPKDHFWVIEIEKYQIGRNNNTGGKQIYVRRCKKLCKIDYYGDYPDTISKVITWTLLNKNQQEISLKKEECDKLENERSKTYK